MAKAHSPRHGSLQYWPRKRARCSVARIRSWPQLNQVKPLAFIGYKVGMTHLIVIDNRPRSLTKKEDIFLPATIIDCPPLKVAGLVFYKDSKKISQIWAPHLDKDLGRKISLPKKETKKEIPSDFDEIRLLVQTQPRLTSLGAKKPHLLEVALGGENEEKLKYAQQKLGGEVKVEEVFEKGDFIDIQGITKGKGFQGTVKRFGVMIKSHKAEKTKRGIGTLGPWTPKRVDFRVPQPGKMGYHLRTEYNKLIIQISSKPEEINPPGGIKNYGLVKGTYLLLKGSVPGPKKRALVLRQPLRLSKGKIKEAPEIKYIAK